MVSEYLQKFIKWRLSIIALLVLLLTTVVLSTAIGAVSIPPGDVFGIMLSRMPIIGENIHHTWEAKYETIVLQIRMPRIAAGVIVGIALATAGAAMQGLFRNPMADPYIIGVSSGASLGAVSAIVLGVSTALGGHIVPIAAFIGAAAAAFLVYSISRIGGRVPVETLLLSGIAIASFLSALTSLLVYSAGSDMHKVIFWIMGGLWSRTWDHVFMAAPWIMIGSIIIYFFARDLNVMLLGDESAHQMGVSVETVKKILLGSSALIAAAAVSISGIIGFVGLIIPHIMRLIVGPDHRILIPASALMGGIFLVFTDTVARTVIAPVELPVGIITAMFGAPFFIYLLRNKGKAVSLMK